MSHFKSESEQRIGEHTIEDSPSLVAEHVVWKSGPRRSSQLHFPLFILREQVDLQRPTLLLPPDSQACCFAPLAQYLSLRHALTCLARKKPRRGTKRQGQSLKEHYRALAGFLGLLRGHELVILDVPTCTQRQPEMPK